RSAQYPSYASAVPTKLRERSVWHFRTPEVFPMILRDTAHQDAEQKIRTSIQEKEDQVNAVRHRVQNNLQIVTSLMGLQARMMTGPQTQLMVQEGLNRVRSMELLQERLYQSNPPTELDYRQYLRELAAHLYDTYGVSTGRVNLNISFAESSIN